MDANRILADLEAERQRIEEAIMAIRRLVAGGQKRRGRPPSWLAQVADKPKRGRPIGSKNKPKPMGTSERNRNEAVA